MILINVSGTARADSLAFFALNIENLFADINKPEKWNISFVFSSTVFQGLSNDALIFKNRSSYFRRSEGARNSPPPPISGACYKNSPVGRGLKSRVS